MEKTTRQIHYLRAWRRRFGFQVGQSFVAVKEYKSRENLMPDLSFIVALNAEQTTEEIERLIRTEVIKRVGLIK